MDLRSTAALLEVVRRLLGSDVSSVEPIAGDASTRRFHRLRLRLGGTVVAVVYPAGSEDSVRHDHGAQAWARDHALPVAAPLGVEGRVLLIEDLGETDYEVELRRRGEVALSEALDTLRLFQGCPWRDAPNAPFEAGLFLREVDGFTRRCPTELRKPEVESFIQDLCIRLERHPYRLAHRDFHVNNLVYFRGRAWTVDIQDLRGGPDTYDAVSLLREREGAERVREEEHWLERAAATCQWSPGWHRRYHECAAQRGLKVIGTFLRLAEGGRPQYLEYLPTVRRKTAEALVSLQAPSVLVAAAVGERPSPGV